MAFKTFHFVPGLFRTPLLFIPRSLTNICFGIISQNKKSIIGNLKISKVVPGKLVDSFSPRDGPITDAHWLITWQELARTELTQMNMIPTEFVQTVWVIFLIFLYAVYIYIYIYIDIHIYIHKICFGSRPRMLQTFVRALSREMLLFAAYGRSSLVCSSWWLEKKTSRAHPGAADGSKWPLEPAPEPQNSRKVPLESAPEPQNARRVPLESAPEPQNARRVPLEPGGRRRMLDGCRSSLPRSRSMFEKCRSSPQPWGTFVSCVRNDRSKSAAFCSSFIGINFCSAPPCFVHVMHGFTLVICIYIYIYVYVKYAKHFSFSSMKYQKELNLKTCPEGQYWSKLFGNIWAENLGYFEPPSWPSETQQLLQNSCQPFFV